MVMVVVLESGSVVIGVRLDLSVRSRMDSLQGASE